MAVNGLITKVDAKTMNGVVLKGQEKIQETLIPLIARTAKQNGQDFTYTKIENIAVSMAQSSNMNDYRYEFNYPDANKLNYPESVGPAPLKKTGLVAAGVATVAVAFPVLQSILMYGREIVEGAMKFTNYGDYQWLAVFAAAATGVTTAAVKIFKSWKKDSDKVWQLFAQNIGSTINYYLDKESGKSE